MKFCHSIKNLIWEFSLGLPGIPTSQPNKWYSMVLPETKTWWRHMTKNCLCGVGKIGADGSPWNLHWVSIHPNCINQRSVSHAFSIMVVVSGFCCPFSCQNAREMSFTESIMFCSTGNVKTQMILIEWNPWQRMTEPPLEDSSRKGDSETRWVVHPSITPETFHFTHMCHCVFVSTVRSMRHFALKVWRCPIHKLTVCTHFDVVLVVLHFSLKNKCAKQTTESFDFASCWNFGDEFWANTSLAKSSQITLFKCVFHFHLTF